MESNVYSKTLTVLYDDPEVVDVIEKALAFEEENKGNQYYLGFEWYEVGASPQTLNMLVMRGVLKISYKSNKSTMYSFVDRDAVRKALEDFRSSQKGSVEVEVKVPEDLFSIIVLHDDKKEIILKALRSDKPVHFLLVGVPGSAKSLFLLELQRLPMSKYVLGSSLSKAGIYELMFEESPRYLIIDELDKVDSQDNVTALLSLMESGILVETKYKRRREGRFKTWVFAGANYLHRISPELRSRFLKLTFNEYAPDEFVEVAVNVLVKREGVDQALAEHIAYKLLKEVGTKDVRDAVRVARLAKTVDEADRIIEIMKRNTPPPSLS